MPAKESTGEEKVVKKGLMFVLEDVGFDAHEVMFSSVKKMLQDREVELTPSLFSAHFVSGSISRNIPHFLRVLGRERLSEEKLAAEISDAIVQALTAKSADHALKAMVEKARAKGVAVGVVSLLSDEAAEALVKKAGLEGLLDGVVCCGNDGLHLPSSDAWRRLAKGLGVKSIRTLAVSSSVTSMRAALRAGCRACILETPYSCWQDFGGADAVVSSLKELQSYIVKWLDVD